MERFFLAFFFAMLPQPREDAIASDFKRTRHRFSATCTGKGGDSAGDYDQQSDLEQISPPRSDDDGFLVFAEDAAKGVGDFADGGISFDGSEDGGEKIFGSGGAALELGKGGFG